MKEEGMVAQLSKTLATFMATARRTVGKGLNLSKVNLNDDTISTICRLYSSIRSLDVNGRTFSEKGMVLFTELLKGKDVACLQLKDSKIITQVPTVEFVNKTRHDTEKNPDGTGRWVNAWNDDSYYKQDLWVPDIAHDYKRLSLLSNLLKAVHRSEVEAVDFLIQFDQSRREFSSTWTCDEINTAEFHHLLKECVKLKQLRLPGLIQFSKPQKEELLQTLPSIVIDLFNSSSHLLIVNDQTIPVIAEQLKEEGEKISRFSMAIEPGTSQRRLDRLLRCIPFSTATSIFIEDQPSYEWSKNYDESIVTPSPTFLSNPDNWLYMVSELEKNKNLECVGLMLSDPNGQGAMTVANLEVLLEILNPEKLKPFKQLTVAVAPADGKPINWVKANENDKQKAEQPYLDQYKKLREKIKGFSSFSTGAGNASNRLVVEYSTSMWVMD